MRQLKITERFTTRHVDSLEIFLQEIGKEEMITAQEEFELAKKIRDGDQVALEKLVKANLRFVVSVAKQYQNQGLSLPDLINEGNLGLIKVAKKFDETRGFKFISYAVWWIRQSIMQALAENARIVRLPLSQIRANNQVQKKLSQIEQKVEREVTSEEIANEIDMDASEISFLLGANIRHISLDAPLPSDESKSFIDILECEGPELKADHEIIQQELSFNTQRMLATLTPRQAEMTRLYYGLGGGNQMTHEEIGEMFDLSREGVRLIIKEGIEFFRRGERRRKIQKLVY